MVKKLLILESDSGLLSNLVEIFEMEGYKVDFAFTIPEVKKKLISNKPDLLICNQLTLNGSFKKFIEEFSNDIKRPKIIVLNDDGNKKRFEFVDECIAIPFSTSELITALKKLSN